MNYEGQRKYQSFKYRLDVDHNVESTKRKRKQHWKVFYDQVPERYKLDGSLNHLHQQDDDVIDQSGRKKLKVYNKDDTLDDNDTVSLDDASSISSRQTQQKTLTINQMQIPFPGKEI